MTETRFLNIPADSPLYTGIGRCIERCHITELPQFLHVWSGQMSIVGNRPLPQDVARALEEAYPGAEGRFDSPCGLTGPVQLVGRENITDRDRLAIEIAYAGLCRRAYSVCLDVYVLIMTVIVALAFVRPRTVEEVIEAMERFSALPVGEREEWLMYVKPHSVEIPLSQPADRSPVDYDAVETGSSRS